MKKKCVFHIPYKMDLEGKAAPMIRPKKMIKAFENIGYEVNVVDGYAIERKIKMKEIIKQIKSGEKYQFLYSESSTEPTLLTESHHMPIHPFFEFSFFQYLKNHRIRIGLFYRDIYWKFDDYKDELPAWKSFCAIQCYKYDIWQYEKLLDKLYLPSLNCYKYLKSQIFDNIVDTLPPGCDEKIWKNSENYERKKDRKKGISIFYVGGLGGHYQLKELVVAISELKGCRLSLCCRKVEWEKVKDDFSQYMNENINVVHKSGKELEKFYSETDICSLMFKPDIYSEMAIPYKSFEYLAHGKPMLASKGTAIGDFVRKNDIGWVLNYDRNEIKKQLQELIDFPELLDKKRENCLKVRERNTWEDRAKKVEKDLS